MYSIYTYKYIQIHTYVHTHIHTYIHTYIDTYIHTYVQTDRQTNTGQSTTPTWGQSLHHFHSGPLSTSMASLPSVPWASSALPAVLWSWCSPYGHAIEQSGGRAHTHKYTQTLVHRSPQKAVDTAVTSYTHVQSYLFAMLDHGGQNVASYFCVFTMLHRNMLRHFELSNFHQSQNSFVNDWSPSVWLTLLPC